MLRSVIIHSLLLSVSPSLFPFHHSSFSFSLSLSLIFGTPPPIHSPIVSFSCDTFASMISGVLSSFISSFPRIIRDRNILAHSPTHSYVTRFTFQLSLPCHRFFPVSSISFISSQNISSSSFSCQNVSAKNIILIKNHILSLRPTLIHSVLHP